MAWLERTVEGGFPCWPYFRVDPYLQCLHETRLMTDLERQYSHVPIRRV